MGLLTNGEVMFRWDTREKIELLKHNFMFKDLTKGNSGYSKPCIFCKQEIKMSNDSGNWLPYNLNGTLHECRGSRKGKGKDKDKTPEMAKAQLQTTTLTLESLDLRLKKIEYTLYGDSK